MPNPLHANDRPGTYPPSWYQSTVPVRAPIPPLEADLSVDVCVIGAGYTGLSSAIHLAEFGYDVVVLDAHRVGWGASGRNGGQVGSGQRLGQDVLERNLGHDHARVLWLIAEEAKSTVRALIRKHAIRCDYRPGVAGLGQGKESARLARSRLEHLERSYGYDKLELLDDDSLAELVGSSVFRGGFIDWGAGHLHPLKFALGLADAARAIGVQLFEMSEAEAIKLGKSATVKTAKGSISANAVVIACNGYLGAFDTEIARRVMPINSFMIATEPLDESTAKRLLRRDVAAYDDRFVVNYFRKTPDHRLLFGGGESYGVRFPPDIAHKVRKRMLRIFPDLGGIRIDYAWGGTLAITRNRMPHFARVENGIYSASGYSGHGVAMATMAGKIIARAINGDLEKFDVMSRVPTPGFPGGNRLRSPVLALALVWFAIRDRIL